MVFTDQQAKELFGMELCSLFPGEYTCEESILLKQYNSYTVIADNNDTFILKIKKEDMLAIFPKDVIEQMTENCLNRSEFMRKRITDQIKLLTDPNK